MGALEQTGEVLGRLDRLPIVGENAGELSERVRRTGRTAVRSARSSRESVENVSTLLGISIALIPTIPTARGRMSPQGVIARSPTRS